mmetsp:Transcript_34959/g.88869  ORF Transcript_34959/g.88869 Transcript_34959/m.88869 type:complete len:225 (+) Transcript_34959:2069-2743(+)
MKAIFFSMSVDIICNWLETCASKSLILLVTFFINWLSPAFRERPAPPPVSSAPPLANSDKTRDSNFLKRSVMSDSVDWAFWLSDACNSRDSAETTSEAYFLTSCSTWERSAVEASRKVENMESVSLRTLRSCSHSASTSETAILAQAFVSKDSTDSVCLWPACMVSMRRFWLANMATKRQAEALTKAAAITVRRKEGGCARKRRPAVRRAPIRPSASAESRLST